MECIPNLPKFRMLSHLEQFDHVHVHVLKVASCFLVTNMQFSRQNQPSVCERQLFSAPVKQCRRTWYPRILSCFSSTQKAAKT